MKTVLNVIAAAFLMIGLASCAGEITVEDGVFNFDANTLSDGELDYLIIDMTRGRTSDKYTVKYLIDDNKNLQMTCSGATATSPYSFTLGGDRSLKLRFPELEEGEHTVELEFSCSKTNQIQYLTVPFVKSGIPVSGIKATTELVSLSVGGVSQVNVDVTPEEASNKVLSIAVSDPSVAEARISDATKNLSRQVLSITALKKGSVIITLQSADGGVSAGVGVEVK